MQRDVVDSIVLVSIDSWSPVSAMTSSKSRSLMTGAYWSAARYTLMWVDCKHTDRGETVAKSAAMVLVIVAPHDQLFRHRAVSGGA